MPATFAGTNSLNMNNSQQPMACGSGGTRCTISCWVKPTASQSGDISIIAEDENTADTNPYFGIRMSGLNIAGYYIDGATSVNTPNIALAVDTWNLLIFERNGDTITLSAWLPNATDFTVATQTGAGTASNPTTIDTLEIGRPGFSGSSRFIGQIAFVAGWNGVLSALDKRKIWNAGQPSRLVYSETFPTPVYMFPLSDNTGAIRYKFILSDGSSSGSVTYADNTSVWEQCGDPIGYDADFLDEDPDIVAFWQFQEAAPGPYYDRINNLQLAYDNVVSGNGASSNNIRVGDGIFGAYSQRIDQLGFYVPADCDLLHFPGQTEFTIIAWIKPFQTFTAGTQMGLVAGVWEEGNAASGDRQFALFHSLRDLNDDAAIMPPGTVNCHTSNDGGITEPYEFNYEVSASGNTFKPGEYACLAVTWDGSESRSYLNGVFVERYVPGIGERNPYAPGYTSLHDSSSPFRMGGVKVSGAGTWGNWLNSDIAGLAVFNRCKSAQYIYEASRGQTPQTTGPEEGVTFLTAEQLFDRYDTRNIAQLVTDNNTQIPLDQLPQNNRVWAAIQDASAELKSALTCGFQYTEENLTELANRNSPDVLRLVAALSMGYLYERRGIGVPDSMERTIRWARETLVELQKGRKVLDLDTNRIAQNPTPVMRTQTQRIEGRSWSTSPIFPVLPSDTVP